MNIFWGNFIEDPPFIKKIGIIVVSIGILIGLCFQL
jgi:hypothetical protein